MRLIFYSAVNGTPICSVYAKEYLNTYIYANHPHRFGLKLQPVCQPEVLFSDFLTAKEVIIPIFATYHILYSPRKTVERSKKGNQAPKQTVA